MKKPVLLLVLAVVVAGGVFAQQARGGGYVKPTFGFGFTSFKVEQQVNSGYPPWWLWAQSTTSSSEKQSLFAVSLDVDFVNAFGLTFGLQSVMAWDDDVAGVIDLYSFGVGYTFNASKWCAGAKLMAVPYGAGGLGFDVNGTYWFNQHIGITGIGDFYFNLSGVDWTIFSIRVGISARL